MPPDDEEQDLAACWREIEPQINSADQDVREPAWRRVAWHIMQIERKLNRMIASHTVDGEEIDVASSYKTLLELVVQGKQVQHMLWWAQAGVWIFGLIAPLVLALTGYIWWKQDAQIVTNRMVNEQQNAALANTTQLLGRMQEVQEDLVYEVRKLREGDKR